MLFQRKKIPCYVLVFEQVDIIKKTLNFLAKYADRLDIIAIENPSENTPAIKAFMDKLGAAGKVKRYYLFDKNITSGADSAVIMHEADFIKKSPFVIITDGDVTVEHNDWLEEEQSILRKHRDVFCCGVTLDMSNLPIETFPEAANWIPKDAREYPDFYEVRTGAHLLLFRSSELLAFIDWKNREGLQFVDGNLHAYCYDVIHKKWARTKRAKAYHLTWDLYFDRSHPYTKRKLDKSFHATWYHNETAGYQLTEY